MRRTTFALILAAAGTAAMAGQQTTKPANQPTSEAASGQTGGQTAQQATEGSHPPVPFTEEFLLDEENIAAGQVIWEEQCRHCHGAKAYPGKAPKLRPARYKPEFVYRRVTDGFRKMPPWKDVYTDEERMQITAYILSPNFAP